MSLKRNSTISMIASLGLFLSNCNTTQGPLIRRAHWLVGTWENPTSRGSIYETWLLDSDRQLSAKSYMIKEGDTLIFETIHLVEKDGDLLYVPTVQNQNEGQPVSFELTEHSPSELVFENPEHDFPQMIRYRQISTDSLVAEISGIKNGEQLSSRFHMSRVH